MSVLFSIVRNLDDSLPNAHHTHTHTHIYIYSSNSSTRVGCDIKSIFLVVFEFRIFLLFDWLLY